MDDIFTEMPLSMAKWTIGQEKFTEVGLFLKTRRTVEICLNNLRLAYKLRPVRENVYRFSIHWRLSKTSARISAQRIVQLKIKVGDSTQIVSKNIR